MPQALFLRNVLWKENYFWALPAVFVANGSKIDELKHNATKTPNRPTREQIRSVLEENAKLFRNTGMRENLIWEIT